MGGKAPDELSQKTSDRSVERIRPVRSGSPESKSHSLRHWPARALALAALPALFALAGCGGTPLAGSSNGAFSISPGTAAIDTNCTGCNTTNSSGATVEQFSATLSGGGAASVTWSVSGGDANSGPGTITASGQYTPPPYLTANSVQVTVTATLTSGTGAGTQASAIVTVTPGFLQPLTPENVALGSGGTVTITGYIAEAGGSTGINYAVSNTSTGSSGGQGSVGSSSCVRSTSAFTYCTVTYTAPGTVSSDCFNLRGGHRWHVVLERGRRSAVEYRGDLQQSCHAPGATAHADPPGQLRRQQQRLRHQRQSDCGLLRRHAGLFDPEQQRNAIPAQLQSRAGAQRSGQHGRNDYPAGTDRQQLHAQWRRFRNHPGGRFDGLAPAKFQLDQRRRSHRASGFRRGEHQRRNSGIGRVAGQRHPGCCAPGDFLDGRQG